ncbi:hypothetical protein BD626DRAFT_492625 [Schizophyllum amplum]|uniref:Uncharacterized protein n=1 Tax=Schizophyllum amplum TaxID=97359 RepID=A0A550CG27_9AGAR|nr:hypothetical protein BD626DRAFT_492625 [Auriculariopsis ampla]
MICACEDSLHNVGLAISWRVYFHSTTPNSSSPSSYTVPCWPRHPFPRHSSPRPRVGSPYCVNSYTRSALRSGRHRCRHVLGQPSTSLWTPSTFERRVFDCPPLRVAADLRIRRPGAVDAACRMIDDRMDANGACGVGGGQRGFQEADTCDVVLVPW